MGGKLTAQIAVALEHAAQGRRVVFACATEAHAGRVRSALQVAVAALGDANMGVTDRIEVKVTAFQRADVARITMPRFDVFMPLGMPAPSMADGEFMDAWWWKR